MRIVWYSNVLLPLVAKACGLQNAANSAGWIEGFLDGLLQRTDIQLYIFCPYNTQQINISANKLYYVIPETLTEEEYKDLLNKIPSPDILHIFGTESKEVLKLAKAFNKPEATVVNIQGMITLIKEVYTEGLPLKNRLRTRLFERIHGHSLLDQQKRFSERSITEKELLLFAKHCIGRTDIDKMFSLSINPQIHYHFCNEILRSEFYSSEKWNIDTIKRHTIMFRSTPNPLKGLHMILQALPTIKKIYPDVCLKVVGSNIFIPRNIKQRFVESTYNMVIRKLIEENNLWDNIEFMGQLNAPEMNCLYLKSHVVVSASIIENESNVISEAKILGVPVVASFVGGIPTRITHNVDGFLYQFNIPSMLSYYVCQLFSDDLLAKRISNSAIRSQELINDKNTNIKTLLEIYTNILNENQRK